MKKKRISKFISINEPFYIQWYQSIDSEGFLYGEGNFSLTNKDKTRKNARGYYQEHRKEYSEYNKKYHENNKEKISKRHIKYYQQNKIKILEKQKIYHEMYYENKK